MSNTVEEKLYLFTVVCVCGEELFSFKRGRVRVTDSDAVTVTSVPDELISRVMKTGIG